MPSSDTSSTERYSEFLALLTEVGLLTHQQLERAFQSLPAEPQSDQEAAQQLVAKGHLTSYQATRLLQGKRDGYLLGSYVLEEPLGNGRTGRIFKARHRTMGRVVAVKVLASLITQSEALLNHFLQEAKSLARLVHPNVVTVLDVNQIGRRLYLVLEYLDGAGADVWVQRTGRIAPAQAIDWIRQASLGLQHAHDHQVLHGEIVPSSLLVGRPSGVRLNAAASDRLTTKLTNFGLRGPDQFRSILQSNLDPVDYRAPETFLQAASLAPASDVYSLGCVLVYLITGKPPFPVPHLEGKLYAHLHQSPPDLHHLDPTVPPAVARLVQQMLAKDPTQRPRAHEVAQQLHPYADSDDPTARIDFNIPQSRSGSTATSNRFLTGINSASGPMTLPPRPALAEDDTSPWSDLNQGTEDGTDSGLAVVAKPRSSSRPSTSHLPTLVVVVALTICLATFSGIVLAIRHFAR